MSVPRERIAIRYVRYDRAENAMVLEERPFYINPRRHQVVRMPVLRPGGNVAWLVLEDCGRRDRTGTRVFEHHSTAVRH